MTPAVSTAPGQVPEQPWSSRPEETARALGTHPATGLADDEVRRRLELGRNVLPVADPPSIGALVLEQLRETMIVVLLAAALLTAAVGDFADTLIIAIVVTLNTTLGVVQQRRAQRSVSALSSLTAPHARVLRDGRTHLVDARDIVPGDVLELEAGDLVPADGRVVKAEGLEADEAPLTGESQPARKDVPACPPDSAVADRTSMLHGGTLITRGRGRLIVTATGSNTQVGQLARLLVTTSSPPTPLQVRLTRFGRQVAAATAALCLLVLVLGLLQGEEPGTMVLTAISLAVAAIPESLPAVLVLSLAMAAQRMAKRSAVVRTLPAVEALGAVTVVASDKTGTLTEGTMFATGFWTTLGSVVADGDGYSPDGQLVGPEAAVLAGETLLRAVALCNDARLLLTEGRWTVAGDPMEGALLSLAGKGGHDAAALRVAWPRVSEYGFDHTRARMTTVHRTPDEQVAVLCKGAPEVVLDLLRSDDPAVLDQARDEVLRLTDQGLRVLAVALATLSDLPRDASEAEHSLQLLGLVALHDPPRAAAAAAVAGCRAAGVVPIMITGDHPTTAAAIARQLGILEEGGLVVTGRDVNEGLDPSSLRHIRVFARTAPEQKLAIVQALRASGEVVAMTGDGVNDAPALRSADIGVAMGRSGTDVARQAADVVLVDDNFATLVVAVEEGRRVYDNVRRFLLYAMSGGVAEVLLMLTGPAVGIPLPLLPGQILWVNMLTHGLPGVALGAEQAEDDSLNRPPRDPRAGVLGDGLLQRILALGAFVGLISLGVGVWAESAGLPWQSMVFVTLTLQQLGIALSLRSQQRSMLKVGLRGNPLLLASLVLNGFLLWLAVAWGPLAGLLGTESLTAQQLGLCLLAALPAVTAVEAAKAVGRHRR